MQTIDVHSKLLTAVERQQIEQWFADEVLPEVPNGHIDQVVIFYEEKPSHTSILCEFERPDVQPTTGAHGITSFALAGAKR